MTTSTTKAAEAKRFIALAWEAFAEGEDTESTLRISELGTQLYGQAQWEQDTEGLDPIQAASDSTVKTRRLEEGKEYLIKAWRAFMDAGMEVEAGKVFDLGVWVCGEMQWGKDLYGDTRKE